MATLDAILSACIPHGALRRVGASVVAGLAGLVLGTLLLYGTLLVTTLFVGFDRGPTAWDAAFIFVSCAVCSGIVVAYLVRAVAVRLDGFVTPTVGVVAALFDVAAILGYIVASDFTFCDTNGQTFPLISSGVFVESYCAT
jgi:hypothetical protein